MKRLIFFAMMLSLSLSSCNGQKKDLQKDVTKIEPKTDVKVNKEYDENGNLIRYDSTYTYGKHTVRYTTLFRHQVSNSGAVVLQFC